MSKGQDAKHVMQQLQYSMPTMVRHLLVDHIDRWDAVWAAIVSADICQRGGCRTHERLNKEQMQKQRMWVQAHKPVVVEQHPPVWPT